MYSSSINNFDVIIIGAGLSGMTAAYTIFEKEPGLNILVLEAQGTSQIVKKGLKNTYDL